MDFWVYLRIPNANPIKDQGEGGAIACAPSYLNFWVSESLAEAPAACLIEAVPKHHSFEEKEVGGPVWVPRYLCK